MQLETGWISIAAFALSLLGSTAATPRDPACEPLQVEACAAGARPEAMQASPHPFEEVQPDGTRIRLYLRGSFDLNGLEDESGFTVVKDGATFVYAELDGEGRLVATGHVVGRARPKELGLRRHMRPSRHTLPSRDLVEGGARAWGAQAMGETLAPTPSTSGVLKNVVILLRFANHTARALPSPSDIDVIFNAQGGDPVLAPTGSVQGFFLENSYGALKLESTVVSWVTLPETEQYYAGGHSGLSPTIHEAIRTALDEADALVDFREFDQDHNGYVDAITFLHSGYAAEFGQTDGDGTPYSDRIWSHRWVIPTWTSQEGVKVYDYHISPSLWGVSGSEPGHIGVICHETGHFLGLPDLYDTDGDDPGEGIGSWGLMANSWGFDGTQLYPPHLCAWSKIQLGWVQPTVIQKPGVYAVPQAESSPAVYRIDLGYPSGEYLLIENRQPFGFESDIPQGGLCIWHIDDRAGFSTQGYPGQAGWPENGNHYRVALLQADGRYDLERGSYQRGDAGDPYHAAAVDRLGPDTLPSTDAYQGGRIIVTGNRIDEISASGPIMRFRFSDGRPAQFLRGDTNESGGTNLTDAIYILRWLFQGGPEPSCQDASDVDDSGAVNLSDPVLLLNFLFLAGIPPAAPAEACGQDPTEDDLTGCYEFNCNSN